MGRVSPGMAGGVWLVWSRSRRTARGTARGGGWARGEGVGGAGEGWGAGRPRGMEWRGRGEGLLFARLCGAGGVPGGLAGRVTGDLAVGPDRGGVVADLADAVVG